jgi:WD40 repeat protein
VNAVTSVATPDGRSLVISGSDDGTVRVWDLTTAGTNSLTLTGHSARGTSRPAWVTSVAALVLDGRALALTASGSEVLAWDLSTGKRVGRSFLEGGLPTPVTAMAVGGRMLVTRNGHNIFAWDLTTGAPVEGPLTGQASWASAVGVLSTPMGRPLGISGDRDHAVQIWDVQGGWAFGQPLRGHTGRLTAVAALAVGDRALAVTGSADRTVRAWDLTTRQPVGAPLTVHMEVSSIAAVPLRDDLALAVVGGKQGLVVAQVPTA